MIYIIFRNNIEVAGVKPLDNSELRQKKQQEDFIQLNFVLNDFVELQIGDYIKFKKNGVKYYLNKLPRIVEQPKKYSYECIFEGSIHNLSKRKVFFDTSKVEGGSYRDYKFPLTGNAETLLSFIVDNLNRYEDIYIAGTFKDTSTTTVDFNNWNVFEAITALSDKLSFDWWIEEQKNEDIFTGFKVLHFDAREAEIAIPFHVGRDLGFTSLTRTRVESENIETVVYGYGSTENLPPRTASQGLTYDSETLTENRLSFVGEDGESKLTKNVDTYGVVESVQEFEDIKPEFTGEVSAINSSDNRIFYDYSINFDIEEQKLSGILPKITFLTGKLIGLTFNISYYDDNQRITMDYYSDESGAYPNDIIFAEVGDQYKLFDIVMPEVYILDAANRLKEATQTYIDDQGNPKDSHTAAIDKEFIQKNNIVLDLGILIRVISGAFLIDRFYEMKEITQKITNLSIYSVVFGDIIPVSKFDALKITKFTTDQDIYNVSKNSVTNNSVTNIVGDANQWE